jgi:dienelactone hydrolase
MSEVLLFHHAQGCTAGVLAFAEKIRQAGHTVHVPDLYQGRIFNDLEAGVGYAREVGFDTIIERGLLAANALPHHLVYAGFSLGALPAQKLAQTRQGAAGALLFHACVPVAEFSRRWPQDVPVQVHAMNADKRFVEGGDLDAARELIASAAKADLFLYPGDQHLFVDNSLPSYDEAAAALLTARVIFFLDAIR